MLNVCKYLAESDQTVPQLQYKLPTSTVWKSEKLFLYLNSRG